MHCFLLISSFPIAITTTKLENNLEDENVVKLYNYSKEDIISFSLIGYKDTYNFGALKHQESLILCYKPDYSFGDARKYHIKSNPKLVIQTKNKMIESRFPRYMLGDIVHLSLGERFKAETDRDCIKTLKLYLKYLLYFFVIFE